MRPPDPPNRAGLLVAVVVFGLVRLLTPATATPGRPGLGPTL